MEESNRSADARALASMERPMTNAERITHYHPNEVFCATDGWLFNRDADGSVQVCAPYDTYVRFDSYIWAYIVAYVSAEGDDAFAAALRLHDGIGD